jgi:hypothetical protein
MQVFPYSYNKNLSLSIPSPLRTGIQSPLHKPVQDIFERLGPKQKASLRSLFYSMIKGSDRSMYATVFGKRPASYLTLSPQDANTLEGLKYFLSSKNIVIISGQEQLLSRKSSSIFKPVFFINKKNLKATIQENKWTFESYLGPTLNVDELYDALLREDSPIWNIKDAHGLIGHMLGYPEKDVEIFEQECLQAGGITKRNNLVTVKNYFATFMTQEPEKWAPRLKEEEAALRVKIGDKIKPDAFFNYLLKLHRLSAQD